MDTDVLIVGGGLSGLSLALALFERGSDFQLFEARDTFGGRIQTASVGGRNFDLGPAWFWPGQPRMASLIERIQLDVFEQYSTGDLMFEDEHGVVHRGLGYASMRGSLRVVGGMGALVDGMLGMLPSDRLHLSRRIHKLSLDNQRVTVRTSSGETHSSERAVLALPPRLATNLEFDPALPQTALSEMSGIATWMAGQAKAVALYDRPFWREAGLSGDAMSRRGPLAEIHDASPEADGPFALFGFVGVPPERREKNENLLEDQIRQQLARIFGKHAETPNRIILKDWAFDPLTATALDAEPQYVHPHYGLPHSLNGLWGNRLIFSGTEVAPQFGGYLEGALESAENTLRALDK